MIPIFKVENSSNNMRKICIVLLVGWLQLVTAQSAIFEVENARSTPIRFSSVAVEVPRNSGVQRYKHVFIGTLAPKEVKTVVLEIEAPCRVVTVGGYFNNREVVLTAFDSPSLEPEEKGDDQVLQIKLRDTVECEAKLASREALRGTVIDASLFDFSFAGLVYESDEIDFLPSDYTKDDELIRKVLSEFVLWEMKFPFPTKEEQARRYTKAFKIGWMTSVFTDLGTHVQDGAMFRSEFPDDWNSNLTEERKSIFRSSLSAGYISGRSMGLVKRKMAEGVTK